MLSQYAWFPVSTLEGEETCILRVVVPSEDNKMTECQISGTPYLIPTVGNPAPLLAYRDEHSGTHYVVGTKMGAVERRALEGTGRGEDRMGTGVRVFVRDEVIYCGKFRGKMARLGVKDIESPKGWRTIAPEEAPLSVGAVIDLECGLAPVWRVIERETLSVRTAHLLLKNMQYQPRFRDARRVRVAAVHGESPDPQNAGVELHLMGVVDGDYIGRSRAATGEYHLWRLTPEELVFLRVLRYAHSQKPMDGDENDGCRLAQLLAPLVVDREHVQCRSVGSCWLPVL